MTSAWVLLTALPPTRGHLNLIRFAASVCPGGGPGATDDGRVKVLVCTQPDEPFTLERPRAIHDALDQDLRSRTEVIHFAQQVQQVPNGDDEEGFWAMWTSILRDHGFEEGDFVVASEGYGVELARHAGGRFIPYDLHRDIYDCDATRVRADPLGQFHHMLATFSRRLSRRITFFGAESTGKTTLTAAVAQSMDSYHLPEWARPYLEAVGPEVTDAAMHAIWIGQRSMQQSMDRLDPLPFVLQDTDLFSTLGYWEMYDRANVPPGLADDARATRSDLYIVCPSNIPFHADPLRYGVDRRESTDSYWIDLLERFELPYVVLTESDPAARFREAHELVLAQFDQDALAYDRIK
ncbi:nicotinamide-nucleotide adenylyltransferase [soil metagenome]